MDAALKYNINIGAMDLCATQKSPIEGPQHMHTDTTMEQTGHHIHV